MQNATYQVLELERPADTLAVDSYPEVDAETGLTAEGESTQTVPIILERDQRLSRSMLWKLATPVL